MAFERRHDKRVRKSILFKVLPSELRERTCEDIGLGGFCMVSNDFYDLNDRVQLELQLMKGQTIYCQARVIWIHPRTRVASIFRTGLKFENLSADDQSRLKEIYYIF